MGRSNNQRRRTAKNEGRTFVPSWTKSKTKRLFRHTVAMKAKNGGVIKKKKLPYHKIVGKGGKVTARRFKAGGATRSQSRSRKST